MGFASGLFKDLKEKRNLIRQESIRMCCSSASGHPGGSLSEADLMAVLYFHVMNIDPRNPKLRNRDRLHVSKGHACPGWYAELVLKRYFPVEGVSTFRQINNRLQRHQKILIAIPSKKYL